MHCFVLQLPSQSEWKMFDKFSIKISQNTKNAIVFIYKVKTEVCSKCKIDKKFAMLGKSM